MPSCGKLFENWVEQIDTLFFFKSIFVKEKLWIMDSNEMALAFSKKKNPGKSRKEWSYPVWILAVQLAITPSINTATKKKLCSRLLKKLATLSIFFHCSTLDNSIIKAAGWTNQNWSDREHNISFGTMWESLGGCTQFPFCLPTITSSSVRWSELQTDWSSAFNNNV